MSVSVKRTLSYVGEQFWAERQDYWGDGDTRDDNEMTSFEYGLKRGFAVALKTFGIWKDGVQRIGSAEEPVKVILEREGIKP